MVIKIPGESFGWNTKLERSWMFMIKSAMNVRRWFYVSWKLLDCNWGFQKESKIKIEGFQSQNVWEENMLSTESELFVVLISKFWNSKVYLESCSSAYKLSFKAFELKPCQASTILMQTKRMTAIVEIFVIFISSWWFHYCRAITV